MKNKISKKAIIRVVLVVLILINCTVIFNCSSDQSEESNKKSGVVVESGNVIKPLLTFCGEIDVIVNKVTIMLIEVSYVILFSTKLPLIKILWPSKLELNS